MSSTLTKEIVTVLVSKSITSTIKNVNLWKSCNLSDDETCRLLAEFIDTAPLLECCKVNYYNIGERPVSVSMKPSKSIEGD